MDALGTHAPAVDGNSITVQMQERGNYFDAFTLDLLITFGEEGAGLSPPLPATPQVSQQR